MLPTVLTLLHFTTLHCVLQKHPIPKIRQPLNLDMIRLLNGEERQERRHSHDPSLTSSSFLRVSKKAPAQRAITDFMGSLHCIVCGNEELLNNHHRRNDHMLSTETASSTAAFLCSKCLGDPAAVLGTLHARLDIVDSKAGQLQAVCLSCTGGLYVSQHATTLFDTSALQDQEQGYGDNSSSARGSSSNSVDVRQTGQGLVTADGCVALDCPVQFSRCQYVSRCEDVRVSLAHITSTYSSSNGKRGTGGSNNSNLSIDQEDLMW